MPHFLHPELLWLVPLVWLAVGVAAAWAQWRTRRRLRLFLGEGMRRIGWLRPVEWMRALRTGLIALGLSLLVLAAARPVTEKEGLAAEAERFGLDFYIAIDASKSMLAEDAGPGEIPLRTARLPRPRVGAGADDNRPTRPVNRLDTAREGIRRLFELSLGDRIGLIAFSQRGYLRAPLTYDTTALDLVLEAIRPENTLPGGSSMVAAMDRAQKLFAKQQELPRKVLVIISDGEELEGDAVARARELRQGGVRIFTVGAGSTAGAPIPLRHPRTGELRYAENAAGERIHTRLDALTLKRVAEAGGGDYLPLGERGEGMERLYRRHLGPLGERLTDTLPRRYNEHFQWPLAVGFLLLLLEFLLRERKLLPEGGAVLATPGPTR